MADDHDSHAVGERDGCSGRRPGSGEPPGPGRGVSGQATVIAFDTAFIVVVLLFVVAAPILVSIKIGLSRYAKFALREP